MQSQEEEDFLIEDAEKILVGKLYHWRQWSIVLDEEILRVWNDAFVLGFEKFSYGFFYFIHDQKFTIMNYGTPIIQTHAPVKEILEKLQKIHQSQMETGPPSQPILSAPGARRLLVGEWSLFCNKEGEIRIQNSMADKETIILKEDLPGFLFETNKGERKAFTAENSLGPEFAAGWTVKREKRFIAKSKLEDLKQKEENYLIEDAEKILVGKPYHWRDWSIVLDKGYLFLWSDAVVLTLPKFSNGWFYFYLDGKLATLNPDGISVKPIHIHLSEILEKLQAIHQNQVETGPPSQPILSAPGATSLVVGEWSLSCNKEGEIHLQNSIRAQISTADKVEIMLKEDFPGFIFQTYKGEKKSFIAANSLGLEFAAGWAVKKEERIITKSKLEDLQQKEEDFVKEDAEEILVGKPYHWLDWSIFLDKDVLYLWNEAVVLGLAKFSFGWFYFILDGKLSAMNPDGIQVNPIHIHVREILEKLQEIHQNQMKKGPPSQPILSAPGATCLVVGEWSLFCNKEGEIRAQNSVTDKEAIVLKEDLPGFIFETDVGGTKSFIAENSLGPEFAAGWTAKKGKRFIVKSKLEEINQKEEVFLKENAEEILPGKPYHWHDWSIFLDDIYLYLWSDAAVLDLCKDSGGWFRFILDGEIAVMHSRGITMNVPNAALDLCKESGGFFRFILDGEIAVMRSRGITVNMPDECRTEILEKLQVIRRNQVKSGPPSQPLLTVNSTTRLVVGNWSLICNTDGEISLRHCIYCKHAIILKEDMPGFIFESSNGKKFSFTAKISLGPEFATSWAGKKGKRFNAKWKLEDLKEKEEDLLLEDAKDIVLGMPYHWREWSIVLDEDYFFLWSDAAVLQLSKGNIGWFRFILDGEIALMYPDGTPGIELDEYKREIQQKLQTVHHSQTETGLPSQPILSTPGSTSLEVGPWLLFCRTDGEIRIHNSFLSQEAIVLKEDMPGFIFETDIGRKKSFTAKRSLGSEFAPGWAKKEGKRFNTKTKFKDLKQKGNLIVPKAGKCSFCNTTLNEDILLYHEEECVYRSTNLQTFMHNVFKITTTIVNQLKKTMKFSE